MNVATATNIRIHAIEKRKNLFRNKKMEKALYPSFTQKCVAYEIKLFHGEYNEHS